ncbi:hypothetical protein M3612_20160 [Niallia taxi]|uniref:hypothetical protein n=1 Tax=Niallia taxi TaxID=2499688 RepID=UPI00203C3BA6|nr:hypothetical protein [Niallia taxi]MCM3216804.1 hypothetical protein [Niallia taxi]
MPDRYKVNESEVKMILDIHVEKLLKTGVTNDMPLLKKDRIKHAADILNNR